MMLTGLLVLFLIFRYPSLSTRFTVIYLNNLFNLFTTGTGMLISYRLKSTVLALLCFVFISVSFFMAVY